jgi:hypothetical protein
MVETPRVKATAAISCPNCGGIVELRGFAHTRSAVCLECLSVIDTSNPQLRILQKFDERMRVAPLIPLGSRGQLGGVNWEVIGFQVRTITADGVDYSWHEYLLFNPYQGFRYLTQYDGHWNDVRVVHGLPTYTQASGRKAVAYGGRVYRHFQNAQATTTFVMGEFPWAVRVGETVTADDYISPPFVLSSEQSGNEINWSRGEYIPGANVWTAFKLRGAPPAPRGVYANQPSPHGERVRAAWRRFLWLAVAWAAMLAWFVFSAANREVFHDTFHYDQSNPGEHSFVTRTFDVVGRGNVEIDLKTDLDNNWAYFNMALLREDGAKGYDFGREVSYYHGRDSDGNWNEGKARDSVTLARVEPGRYYLRIEPEMDAQAAAQASRGMVMDYDVTVRRDVPSTWLLWLALPLLILPPIWSSVRALGFETQRWAESDYGTGSGTASSGEDDDE